MRVTALESSIIILGQSPPENRIFAPSGVPSPKRATARAGGRLACPCPGPGVREGRGGRRRGRGRRGRGDDRRMERRERRHERRRERKNGSDTEVRQGRVNDERVKETVIVT